VEWWQLGGRSGSWTPAEKLKFNQWIQSGDGRSSWRGGRHWHSSNSGPRAPLRPPAPAASHASNYGASLDHLRTEAHVGSPPRSLPSADVFSPVSLLANVHRPRHRPDNRPLARRHTQRMPCELQWPSWSRISSSRPFCGKPAASRPGSPPMSPPLSRTPRCGAGERGRL
jgi:hypothetical protein